MRVASNTLNTLIQTQFNLGVIPPKTGNIKQVTEIKELILLFRYQTLDLPKLTLLHKTLKAAKLAMIDRVALNRTNTKLLAANTKKNIKLNKLKLYMIVKVLVF